MAKRPDDPAQLGLFDVGTEPGGAPAPARGEEGAAPTEATAGRPRESSSPEPDARGQPTSGGGEPAGGLARPSAATHRRFRDGPLPDDAHRRRIRQDLETNLLVEAGAGSGKTTALIERMVALVRSGAASVEELAAVTFTRKAAAELRQRFQTGLESALAHGRSGGDEEKVARLDGALRSIDRAFIGTIHSFCARLLRERPVEAGLDPDFRELMGAEEVQQRSAFWRTNLERLSAADDPLVARLAGVGLSPSRLEGLYDELVANPDVHFPAEAVDPPSDAAVEQVRGELDRLLNRGSRLLPTEPDEKGWDNLQTRLRLLLFLRRVVSWGDRTEFLDVLAEEFYGRSYDVVQKRWPEGARAKALSEEWGALRDGAAADLLDRWWAHRYPIALAFARRTAEAYQAERVRSGTLNFQDLLVLAARLLRTHPEAREQLGRRYRRILVDEFQDTDPVQAEVLLLLTSPPDQRPWQEAVPRDGALFVVGDPKQSIYRFRRADIAVYNLVRDRFRGFGDVVELVANFRSLPPIGELVDAVFGDQGRLGREATAYQAAFAPLRTRRVPEPERQGVHQYFVDPEGRSHAAAASDGAARLAPWIAAQVDAGRSPGDFLILARRKAELATYARELEAWRVPVQVTGAGVDRTEELRELLVLLEALSDPTDPVGVVAVLVGLLFGVDHEQLVEWALSDGPDRRFDITRSHSGDDTAVGKALRRLHGWWRDSRREPADVLVGRIVDDVGLIPLAAARELGELRAGSLLYALDVLRVAALHGDTSVATATDALRTALEADEAEGPLEPVRRGVARVMTLHQAKGLEAPVVALVHPVGGRPHPVVRHIERRLDGTAIGYLVVREKADRFRDRIIARPAGWSAKEAEEQRFDAAEQDRLLYVAATRAGERLVVARKAGAEDGSAWAGLYDWIDANGTELRLEPVPSPDPDPMAAGAEELLKEAERVRADRQERSRPGYEVDTATARAKEGDAGAPDDMPVSSPLPDPRDGPDPAFRGLSWGIAVHSALNAAARGAEGGVLRRVARSALLEAERPVAGGEPRELDELVQLVDRVLASRIWARARTAERVLSEVPFAFRERWDGQGGATEARADGARAEQGRSGLRIMEGVVDLAFKEPDGWVIVDYKTDVGTDPGFPARLESYRRQVRLYSRAWEAMTGEPVVERFLLFTARSDGEGLVAC